ncbi:cell division topological determinant MinJ [Paenibacillus marchantiophytorum]|uniref:Cell division topological determinant MinJ n=1 Tax=Paenibacillus marchantiophytorum TaxID=1619310 RepID=A0ABQ1F2A4_9BACL|nr:PDZ domain-containing protein [Paenibacillus marchantiophytorum]GFZ97809.1 cell division topological determinant MinJ [Paenibacillus marchantiophytorum]
MDVLTQFLDRLLQAVGQLFVNPFYYIGILFIVLHYRKQIQMERKLFHTRLHSLLNETWRTILWGWIGGIGASIVMLFVGVSIEADVIILLWVLTAVLVLFRVRFICLAYAVGILGIAQVLLSWLPSEAIQGAFPVFEIVAGADIPSLLVIVAVLHLLEGFLVGFQGARMASPLFLEGKRGQIVGAQQLQGFWPVPLFLLVPLAGGNSAGLPWETLFGSNLASGWTLLAFPAMIGFTELTISKLPRRQARFSASMLYLYGLILFGAAMLAHYWSPIVLVAAVLSIGLHEGLIRYNQWLEAKQIPFYVHSQRGLMVLSVVPGSPAQELGIQVGEILHKVNGHKIKTKTDLHVAMGLNSAFCRLEVLNEQGEVRFLHRALYAGEHHQLGIILAPDQEALYFTEHRPVHLYSYLRGKLTGLLSNDSTKSM